MPVELVGLSLKPLWAAMMRLGEKRIETRPYRFGAIDPFMIDGEPVYVAIHASKSWDAAQAYLMDQEPFRTAFERHGITRSRATHSDLPRGVIVAVGRCVDVAPSDSPFVKHWLGKRPASEGAFGDYSPDRWCYKFDAVWPVDDLMIFERGRLSPWKLDADLTRRVLVSLQQHEDLPEELTSVDLIEAAEQRYMQLAATNRTMQGCLDVLHGRLKKARTPIDRMIDAAVGRA